LNTAKESFPFSEYFTMPEGEVGGNCMAYDLIGNIHGCADELIALMENLEEWKIIFE
jgi:hypothetical protein